MIILVRRLFPAWNAKRSRTLMRIASTSTCKSAHTKVHLVFLRLIIAKHLQETSWKLAVQSPNRRPKRCRLTSRFGYVVPCFNHLREEDLFRARKEPW